jgi:hypothetical protein
MRIDTTFDDNQSRYEKFTVAIPEMDFSIEVEDTGNTIFDKDVPVVDGFVDNESALRYLAVQREVNLMGVAGQVFRQPMWSTPVLPNVARVTSCNFGIFFERFCNEVNPVGDPVAAWLVREVPETVLMLVEGGVEDEMNDFDASNRSQKAIGERVQRRALNRYNNFRETIRRRAYSDIKQTEAPR